MNEFAIKWDETGKRLYETGVDRGVLYPLAGGKYGNGVAWNGLTGVSENPSGAEATPLYADNIKYLNLMSEEDFGYTINAYTYPDEFAECDGSYEVAEGVTIGQQSRKPFGFAYRTIVGNDQEKNLHGYKIHLVYNCQASPSSRDHSTVNESPEAEEMSWEVTTTKVKVGDKMAATIVVDSTKVSKEKLEALEELLYGSGETQGKLPTPDEVIELFKVVENND